MLKQAFGQPEACFFARIRETAAHGPPGS